jgi:hypothetical protein
MTAAVLTLGVANSILLVGGGEFPKPTRPREVAAIIGGGTTGSSLVVIGEASYHETVVGLTVLRELAAQLRDRSDAQFLFIRRSDRYPTFVRGDADPEIFWSRLAAVNLPPPETMWIWTAASRPQDYVPQFAVPSAVPTTCALDGREAHRTLDDDDGPRGPFRLYRCAPVTR